MTCPTLTATAALTGGSITWGTTFKLNASGADFGGSLLGSPTPVGAEVWLRCGGGFSYKLQIISWKPSVIEVLLPVAAPLACRLPYSVRVVIPRAGPSDVCTLQPLTITGPGLFQPLFGPVSGADQLLVFDDWFISALEASGTDGASLRRLLAGADMIGSKWRYDHLAALAQRRASDALSYEAEVHRLMSMMLTKASTAELLLSPVLMEALKGLADNAQRLNAFSVSDDLKRVITDIAAAATRAMFLQVLLLWLLQFEPVPFWRTLFSSVIRDIGSGDSALSSTRIYLRGVASATGPGSIGEALPAMVEQMRARLDSEVDRMAGPLHTAVGGVIGGTSDALRLVFESFDGTLTMSPPATAGEGDVPNVDPLSKVAAQLDDVVKKVVTEIKQKMRGAIDVTGLSALFEAVMITYIVLPLLAVVVVAAAGGPIGAAVLAGVVCVAAQHLLRLLAEMLSGPLQEQIDVAKGRALEVAAELQGLLARQAASMTSPADSLKILSSELRELRNLLPHEFLAEAARVLGKARDGVVTDAQAIALAAERALGVENASAFDAIPTDLPNLVVQAPQLPGGSDPGRLGGARLLSALNDLERSRLEIRDGKEMQLTHRLSLFRLLGGQGSPLDPQAAGYVAGGFSTLLSERKVIVDLDEEVLLDRNFPGLYRALIKGIRLNGIFSSTPTPAAVSVGIPVTLTHAATSKTRIKRGSNPTAPPVGPPDCLPVTVAQFVSTVGLTEAYLGPVVDGAIDAAFEGWTDQELWQEWVGGELAGELRGPTNQEHFRTALVEHLPEVLIRRFRARTCEVSDWEPVRQAIKATLTDANWSFVPNVRLIEIRGYADVIEGWHAQRVIPANIRLGLRALNLPRRIADPTGAVTKALGAVHARAIQDLRKHFGKWGYAKFEQDPDGNVRALGFVTLVREGPEETHVFNLLSGPIPSAQAASSVAPSDGMAPVTPDRTLQYGPFENLGLGGQLLLELKPETNVNALADILIDVTFRACYDGDLAATLKSSGKQESANLAVASSFTTPIIVSPPGRLPEVSQSSWTTRTYRVSLRAHRDSVLRAAIAAVQAAPQVNLGLPIGSPPSFPSYLSPGSPYLPIGPASSVGLQFQNGYPTSLVGLLNVVPLTPAVLGLPSTLQTSQAALVSIALSVIPAHRKLRIDAAQIDPPLNSLLPTFTSPPPFLGALEPYRWWDDFGPHTCFVLSDLDASEIPLTSLFGSTPVGLTISFGTGVMSTSAIEDGMLYDVIFGLTLRLPVQLVPTTELAVN